MVVAFLVIIVLASLAVLLYIFSTGQQRTETQLKNDNPTFHTITEGGKCRDGMGDCIGGLTCSDGVCAKP